MIVSIIGMGYVGLNLAIAIPSDVFVVGFDTNKELVEQLLDGKSHIEGVPSGTLAKRLSQGNFKPTSEPSDIGQSDIVIIAVPTPLDENRKPDLNYLKVACKTVADQLKKNCLIINESTSSPGTLRDLIKPLIERYADQGIELEFAVSPERVDPGNKSWNLFNTPRLYSGLTPEASMKTRAFYSTFCEVLHEVSSPEVAELAKLFENTFRQVNIALVNEFAQITNALDTSVYEVLEAANTKPFGFMKFSPGPGVGGHCIPVDPTYLSSTALEVGIPAKFIDLANETNLRMTDYVISRIQRDSGLSLKKKRIQIIGVAYKPDVADTRETPAARLIDTLRELGAVVNWHDPLVKKWRNEISSDIEQVDISIIVTAHSILSLDSITSGSSYVFDTTGTLSEAETF